MLPALQLSAVIVKFIFNLSGLIAVGHIIFRQYLPEIPANIRQHSQKLIYYCSIIAFLAAILSFQLNVAILSGAGFSGLFDIHITQSLLLTNVGKSALLRLLALVLMILSCLRLHYEKKLSIIGGTLFIFSFIFVGHTAKYNWFISSVLAFHITSVSFWVGSLLPLYQMCKYDDNASIVLLMKRFGMLAIPWVIILLVTGVTLVWTLLPSLNQLFSSTYGQVLSIKVFIVLLLLSLALLNKMVLVPKLSLEPFVKGIKRLKKVITLEIILVVLILFATSIITTVVGPRS